MGARLSPKPLGGNEEIPCDAAVYVLLRMTGDDTVGSLDMTGGWLTITGTLTVTGPMTWTAGTSQARGRSSWKGGSSWGREPLGDQQENSTASP